MSGKPEMQVIGRQVMGGTSVGTEDGEVESVMGLDKG